MISHYIHNIFFLAYLGLGTHIITSFIAITCRNMVAKHGTDFWLAVCPFMLGIVKTHLYLLRNARQISCNYGVSVTRFCVVKNMSIELPTFEYIGASVDVYAPLFSNAFPATMIV